VSPQSRADEAGALRGPLRHRAGFEFTDGGQPVVRMRKLRKGDLVRPRAGYQPPAGIKLDAGEIGTVSIVEADATGLGSKYRVTVYFPRTQIPMRADEVELVAAAGDTGAPSPAVVIAKGAEAPGKAKAAVDEALADVDAGHKEKAARKRKLTSEPRELKEPTDTIPVDDLNASNDE
jgi:hypothetical protein